MRADESVEAESGVEALVVEGAAKALSIHRRGLVGRWSAGAVDGCS